MSEIIVTQKMVFGGDCISKIQGKTVFVPYAIPGEKLEVEIVKDMRDYCVAEIIKVLEPSPHRVLPFCPYYTKCGGCNMQHISPEHQRTLRGEILKDAFLRENVEIPEVEYIYGSEKSYRSRFQFHNGGLMAKRTNDIVQLDQCPCATKEINDYLREVPFDQRPEGRVHVFGTDRITSIPQGYDKIMIARETQRQKEEKARKIQERTPGGRKLKKQKKIQHKFSGTTFNPENLVTVDLLGKNVTFDVQGFFQSNLEVLEKTIPLVCNSIEGKNVLDMYSGCGTFSVFLADRFENVTMVEHNRDAIVYAEQNMAGTKHESFGLSGETWSKYHAQSCIERSGKFDAVVIDPPRSGMEKSVCQWLCQSGIPQIRSISCDISTHARDAKFLQRAGYKMTKLYLLDFYPQTGHIESLAFFEKQPEPDAEEETSES